MNKCEFLADQGSESCM